MLEGLQRCFCTRCKLRSIFPTCPGFRFYGPRNTFYAHARYLVMVSRRFFGKKHSLYTCSSGANATTYKLSLFSNFLTHAQESCACTRIVCMHKILVHAQESCACARILCMHKNLVLAQVLLKLFRQPYVKTYSRESSI